MYYLFFVLVLKICSLGTEIRGISALVKIDLKSFKNDEATSSQDEKYLDEQFSQWYRMFWDERNPFIDVRESEADTFRNYMNVYADPCENFYEFSCGNWHKHHAIPKDDLKYHLAGVVTNHITRATRKLLTEDAVASTNSSASNSKRKVKDFYTSCMNVEWIEEAGYEPILELLNEFGGWPALDDEWRLPQNFTWEEFDAKLNLFGVPTFISVDSYTRLDDPREHITYLELPVADLGNRNYFTDDSNEHIVSAYRDHMIRIMKLLGARHDKAYQVADELLAFTRNLIKISNYSQNIDDMIESYRPITYAELRKEIRDINWPVYLRTVLNKPPRNDEIYGIINFDYFKSLNKLLSETSEKTIINYGLWRLVFTFIEHLDSRFQYELAKLKQIITQNSESVKQPVWEKCMFEIDQYLGNALGALFVQKYFGDTTKQDVLSLTSNLLQEFRVLLYENTWLDRPTKERAMRKLDSMEVQVGYPEFIMSAEELDKYYESVNIDSTKYFENIVKLREFEFYSEQKFVGKPVNRARWITYPHKVNAFFNPNVNEIFVTAGILQPPLYHKDFPNAVKYGLIGSVIGHEITHGYDSVGRRFDATGAKANWWTEDSDRAFNEQVECLTDQYSNFTLHNTSIDGSKTSSENIADNGGIRLAYFAYQKWQNEHPEALYLEQLPSINLTPDQIFFLSYAQFWCSSIRPESMSFVIENDEHSPSEFRLIGSLQNFDKFSEAYSCPLGTNMNPVNKCRVW